MRVCCVLEGSPAGKSMLSRSRDRGRYRFTPESHSFNRVATVERESLPLECCDPVPPAAAWRSVFAHRRAVYDFALPTG